MHLRHSTFIGLALLLAAGGTAHFVRLGAAAHEAQVQAYAIVYRALAAQAAALAYIDTYWTLALGASIMCGLSLFLKKNIVARPNAAELSAQ